MINPPRNPGGRNLAGTVVHKETNFRFEVWAYRQLTGDEMKKAFESWMRQRDRRLDLRNKLVQVLSNIGR